MTSTAASLEFAAAQPQQRQFSQPRRQARPVQYHGAHARFHVSLTDLTRDLQYFGLNKWERQFEGSLCSFANRILIRIVANGYAVDHCHSQDRRGD